jgi:putative tryptophan/tyrosine transport system substrate-binding protein
MQLDQIKRREFITLLGGTAATWPLAARAQQPAPKGRFPIIGWLVTGSPSSYRHSLAAFRDGLTEAGYVEGRNIGIEYRWGEGSVSRLPELARDLVNRQVNVILTGGSVGAEAAKQATATIPIVAAGVGDLVELGLVNSLARPGGNLTGFIASAPETAAKRFQMIKELMPKAKRAAVLWNPASSNAQLEWNAAKGFAEANDLVTPLYDARDFAELGAALDRIKQAAPDVLVNLNDPFLFTARKMVVGAAHEMRLPAVYGFREYAEDGGLISYGTSISDTYRRAALYVDKILKGEKPADLPVQAPTKYELVINLKTAKALGLTVPDALLARADEVIE